ncbi:MAG TPA: hypothetical protein DCQ36_13425, partial [Actinobacteria bacterium]|nr:hypothetical protein [Actinomycetota bacterium]
GLPGDSRQGARPLPSTLKVASIMRSATDQQWWTFTASSAGQYSIRLHDLPSAYGLGIHHAGGSSSSASSTLTDRVLTRVLSAGQRLDISVSVRNGQHSATLPYSLTVTPPVGAPTPTPTPT